MKKITSKIKDFGNRKKIEPAVNAGRITNETLSEHREKILAGGRRFKYPRQYARHLLIRNSVLIVLGALFLMAIFMWWQLYPAQNTSKFFYRVTQAIPLPVAKVKGESVRYSDYLRELRSEMHYLSSEENVVFSSSDGQRQLEYRKRASLNRVEDNAYVFKLAKELDIKVTDQELESFINAQISQGATPISRDQFIETVLPRYYDWSLNEYKASIRPQLLRQKVAFAVDDAAKDKANKALVAAKKNFSSAVSKYSEDETTKSHHGDVGFVSTSGADPEGVVKIAASLKKGQISPVIQGRSGYFIIKVTDTRSGQVRYQQIFINLSSLDAQIQALHNQKGAIKEYISVSQQVAPQTQQ